MQIVILECELHVEELEQGIERIWGCQVNPKPAVATSFSVRNVLVANPPLVEAQLDSHGTHG